MHRFFVAPDALSGEEATLNGALAHQMAHVLRLQAGARVLLLDGAGTQAEAELVRVSGHAVQARLTARGERMAAEALPGREDLMRRMWDALDDDGLTMLVGLLDAAAVRAGLAA